MHRQSPARSPAASPSGSSSVAWLVAVRWVLRLRRQAGRRAEQRGLVLAASSAESTRALEKLGAFQDANAIPTLVVYDETAGLTDADLAAIEEQATEFAALDGVERPEGRPPPVISPATAEQLGFRPSPRTARSPRPRSPSTSARTGWNALPDAADELRDIAEVDGVDVYIAGAGGQAADAAEAFGGIDTTLLAATLGVVILILLFTYRSPILWVLPIFCAGVALFVVARPSSTSSRSTPT